MTRILALSFLVYATCGLVLSLVVDLSALAGFRPPGGNVLFGILHGGTFPLVLALLPPGAPKGSAHRNREAAGVEAMLLSEMRMVHRAPDGLILGFSGHDLTEIKFAARRLGQAARQSLV